MSGLRRMGLVGASCLFTLLLLEGILRLFFNIPSLGEKMRADPSMFLDSPDVQYRMRPKYDHRVHCPEYSVTYRLNRFGYRGPDFDFARDGRTRILCVGDSFTFGWGVELEQAWPSLLQARLGKGYEVLNAGFQGGPTPDGYFIYLTRFGLKLKPDLVLVGLFFGNDLDHTDFGPTPEEYWAQVDERGFPVRYRDPENPPFQSYFIPSGPGLRGSVPFLRESRLVQAGVNFRLALRRRGMTPGRRLIDPLSIFRRPWDERTRHRAEVLERLLVEMDRRCQAAGVPLVVLFFPCLDQLRADNPQLDYDAPQRYFREALDRHHLTYLDLLDTYRGHQELYYPADQHWTPEGNRVAEKAIYEFLRPRLPVREGRAGTGPG